MKTIVALSLAVASLCVGTVVCYHSYQDLIPNGKSVPSPCPHGGTWAGVGHNKIHGNGPRNSFGVVSLIWIFCILGNLVSVDFYLLGNLVSTDFYIDLLGNFVSVDF